MVFASGVASACTGRIDVRRAATALVLMTGAVGISSVFAGQRLVAQYGGSLVSGRSIGIFAEPNQMGTFCAMGTLVAAGLIFGATSRLARWLAVGGGLGSLVGLLLSLSRGAWIGLTLGVVVLLTMVPAARRILLSVAIPVLVVAFAIGAFAPDNPQVQ